MERSMSGMEQASYELYEGQKRSPLRSWAVTVVLAGLSAIVLLLCIGTIPGVAALNTNVQALAQAQPNVGSAVSQQKVQPSPDATSSIKIAFASTRDSSSGYFHLFTMSSDGTGQTALGGGDYDDTYPAWSADRTHIAFRTSRNGGTTKNIYTMDPNGGSQTQITTGTGQDTEPTWSPDNQHIAYSSDQGDAFRTWDIYVVSASGGTSRQLTTNNTNHRTAFYPAWSPDGSKIAYSNNTDGGILHIYVMNADGMGTALQLTTGTTSDDMPAWSPDGSQIAFSRDNQLMIMNANGSNPQPVGSIQGSRPTWSPSGAQLAYESYTDDNFEIYTVDTNGSNAVDISNSAFDDRSPSWGPTQSVVQVNDEDGHPVQGAEVYSNCARLGNTNANGVVVLPSPYVGEELIARSIVYTGTTPKGSHDGWMYHVWLTNLVQENDGTQTDYTITDTTKITQTVVLKKDNAQIGLNMVASVNYNATATNLADIATGLKNASGYLLDVTDGQMFIEKSTLYEDNAHFADADIQFSPWIWPSADVRGVVSATGHLYMPGPGFDGQIYTGSWSQPSAFRTFVHEFGHYAFGAYDEYIVLGGTQGSATCTLDRSSVPESMRASIMDSQYNSTELCYDSNHNEATAQGQTLNESVWATFVRNWHDVQNRWTLRTPTTRGGVDKGPNTPACINTPDITVVSSGQQACEPPVTAHVQVVISGTTTPVGGASVYLNHGSRLIYEGNADSFGDIALYGAAFGDVVTSTGFLTNQGPNVIYASSAIVNSCDTQLTLNWQVVSGGTDVNGTPSSFDPYWLTSKLDHAAGTLNLSVHYSSQPSSPPSLSVSQDSGAGQAVSLTYDAPTNTYNGSFTYDSNSALIFAASVGVDTSSGSLVSVYQIAGETYNSAGPFTGEGVQQIPRNLAAPSAWQIFTSENMVSLSVNGSSMPDGTGIAVGTTSMPPGTPPNLLAVGGPYSIEGQNAISGQVGVSLNFQAAHYCSLQAGSIAIYHYDPASGSWTQLATNLNDSWNQAYAALSEWGIYAVFAQPSNVATFTDVPAGSTFHDFVEWMACHSIASGYSDGTFHVTSNATRGQISKMVAVAYNWDLEPPEQTSEASEMGGNVADKGTNGNDAYTFADVLPGSTFYLYIEAAYSMGVMSGYPCGGAGEPCDALHRPYFRPNSNATRGQIAKIMSNSAQFTEAPAGQTFQDVPTAQTFYQYIERMASRGIINGYPCGGVGEPCVAPGNLPYFRPASNATRGQLSKIIYLTLQPR